MTDFNMHIQFKYMSLRVITAPRILALSNSMMHMVTYCGFVMKKGRRVLMCLFVRERIVKYDGYFIT